MPNSRIGQQVGRETILECTITAFPHAVNYWEKDEKRINTFGKHRVEAYDEGDHTLTLSLRIHSITVSCVFSLLVKPQNPKTRNLFTEILNFFSKEKLAQVHYCQLCSNTDLNLHCTKNTWHLLTSTGTYISGG